MSNKISFNHQFTLRVGLDRIRDRLGRVLDGEDLVDVRRQLPSFGQLLADLQVVLLRHGRPDEERKVLGSQACQHCLHALLGVADPHEDPAGLQQRLIGLHRITPIDTENRIKLGGTLGEVLRLVVDDLGWISSKSATYYKNLKHSPAIFMQSRSCEFHLQKPLHRSSSCAFYVAVYLTLWQRKSSQLEFYFQRFVS